MCLLKHASFFKILLDPSAPHLPLPPDFVTRHLANNIPQDPKIRSAEGKHSWSLKIKKIGESYCFSDGWNTVVRDNRMEFGDFIIFWLLDQSTFKILIYGINGCAKDLPLRIKHEEDEDYDDDDDPFFVAILNKSHRTALRLPLVFAGLVGIKGEKNMTVKNLAGGEWELGLRLDKAYRKTKRYMLSPGWTDFRQINDLCDGDECVFKFIRSEGKLLLINLTKKKEPATKVVMGKRRRPARGFLGVKRPRKQSIC